jgi:LPS export ABC transporter protein LptC
MSFAPWPGTRPAASSGPQRSRVRLGRAVPRALRAGTPWLLPFILGACGSEPANQQTPPGEVGPQQVVQGMRLRQSEGGRSRWLLVADSALAYGETEPTRLWGVHVDFFGAEVESVRSVLTAREGEVEPRTQALVARGNVVIATREGRRLETEELRWDPRLKKVISDRFVRLTKGRSVITGTGIRADPDLGDYEIRAPVEGELSEEDSILDGI